jgi:hypothetical protein
MRCSHRFAGWRPIAAVPAAGFMAGMMLTGGIAEISAPAPPAPAGTPVGQPPAPGPKTVVITDTGGDGPGPKAVVIPGSGPPPP